MQLKLFPFRRVLVAAFSIMLLFVLPALSVAGADPALVLVVALAEDGVVLAARAVEALLHQVRAVRQRTLARKVAATSDKRGVRVTITTIVALVGNGNGMG